MNDLDLWWQGLRAAALVGTARREVPQAPELGVRPRPDGSREQRLLDAAALADAVRRAGRVAEPAPPADAPAPAETLPVAGPQALQLLELLLVQGPVGGAARDALTRHWLRTAAAAGRIAPPRLLTVLLELGTGKDQRTRRDVLGVLGARGVWLAARNPAWAWAADDGSARSAAQRSADRLTELAALRSDSPDAGRALVVQTWDTDTAADRASSLAGLVIGLGPDDEELLERALDDRAKGVREEASRLLDRLPGSARAHRMADRLRPLLSVRGTLRKTLHVALPDDPDDAAVRDGLVDPGPHVSRRARWLGQVVAGAPLSVWTDLVRGDSGKVVGMLRDDDERTVVAALGTAAASRGDADWARALLATIWDVRLVALLPEAERDRHLADRLSRSTLANSVHEIQSSPRPWGPGLSGAVLRAIGREKDAGHAVRVLRDTLPLALHPSTLPDVERLMNGAGDDTYLRTTLRDVLQLQSLHQAISEAF